MISNAVFDIILIGSIIVGLYIPYYFFVVLLAMASQKRIPDDLISEKYFVLSCLFAINVPFLTSLFAHACSLTSFVQAIFFIDVLSVCFAAYNSYQSLGQEYDVGVRAFLIELAMIGVFFVTRGLLVSMILFS